LFAGAGRLTICSHRVGEQVLVMTEPRAEMTAAMMAYGQLRTSYADREQVIDALKTAFVQGHLTRDELDALTGRALTARTYADLAPVIPVIAARPARRAAAPSPPRTARRFPSREARSSACAVALVAASWLATVITDNAAVFLVAVVVTVCAFLTSPIANSWLLGSGRRKHSGEPLSPPAAATPNFMRGPT
jgi:hypothetical protein